jgi:phosphatidylglycerol:prolipoprotein diacylglycerol transferase
MHPILFEIPGLNWPIRSFGVMVAIGFLVGSHIFTRLAARYGDDPKNDPARYSNITVWIVVGVMIGARAMYVIVQIAMGTADGKHFREDPLSILRIWEGGLVMYGGMIGAILCGMWAARRMKVRAVHALDMGLVGGFVGQAIGRIGCLLVGDDYGKVVPERFQSLPFPITLRVPDPLPPESLFGAENAGKVLWATQPLMMIKALIIAFVGWQILKRRRYAGQVSLWIILMYAVLRSAVELLRGDGVRGVWFNGTVSTSQLVSLVLGSFAATLIFVNRHTQNPLPGATKTTG